MEIRLIPARLQVFFWTIIIRLISESKLFTAAIPAQRHQYRCADQGVAGLFGSGVAVRHIAGIGRGLKPLADTSA